MKSESLEDVVAVEAPRLLALPGVVAVAEGLDRGLPCVVVYTAGEVTAAVPSDLCGYPVVVRRSDEIRAL